jgi:hypothetical protein
MTGVTAPPSGPSTDRPSASALDQVVVAAQQHQGRLAVDHVHERLDLPVGRGLVAGGQVLDGADPGGAEPLGRRQPGTVVGGRQGRGRLLDVGRVPAHRAADHQVLTGVRRAGELHRGAAAHLAAGGLDRDRRDAQALEAAHIGLVVKVERAVQPAPMASQRPDRRHTSAGCIAGRSSSWPPMRSISWRMTSMILALTRTASGRSM